MALIKDGAVVDDPWVAVADEADLPEARPAIVTLERWRAERDALIRRDAPIGVRLASDRSPAEIADDLDRLTLVALEFPVFTDGRAFTSARLLRERYRYSGEIRAVGNVLRDQILFMVRSGFDAFEMDSGEMDSGSTAEEWREAVAEIDVFYQAPFARREGGAGLRRSRPRGSCRRHSHFDL
jgi:uncharacterized protein (DUF934 family)